MGIRFNFHFNVPARHELGRVQQVFILWVAGALLLPLACIAFYTRSEEGFGLEAFGLTVLVMSASWVSGGLLGFLFAVPRANPLSQAPAPGQGLGPQQLDPAKLKPQDLEILANLRKQERRTRRTVLANHNIEDVSDWLTKIVVGLTLVELKSIPPLASDLFAWVGDGLGGGPGASLLAGAIILYSGAAGLMEGWFATRIFILRWMIDVDELDPSDDLPGMSPSP